MTVTILRSGLIATLLALAFLLTAVAGPADAADVVAKHGTPPTQGRTSLEPTADPRTADRSSAQVLVAGSALVLIGAGIGAGAWRARRHPELVTSGH
jgi:hypothetical protein